MSDNPQPVPVPMAPSDPLLPIDSGRQTILISTYNMQVPAEQLRCMQIVLDDRLTTLEMAGNEVLIEHIVATVAELPDSDSGEMRLGQRVFLVPPEGPAVSTTSQGCLDSLRLAVGVWGKPPWKPAHRFLVKRFLTDKKRQCLKLIPIG